MRLLWLGLLAALFVGCTDLLTDSADASWKTHDGIRFSIDYPSNWDVESTETGAVFNSPFKGASLQAGYFPLDSENETLDSYVAENKNQLNPDLLNEISSPEYQVERIELLSEANRTIQGQRAWELEFRTTLKSGLKVRQKQIYLVKNRTAFVVTGSATDDAFSKHVIVFDRAFASFLIK